jgi:hypothetical protein
MEAIAASLVAAIAAVLEIDTSLRRAKSSVVVDIFSFKEKR